MKATVIVFICMHRVSQAEANGRQNSEEAKVILGTRCQYTSLLPLNRYHWAQNKHNVPNVRRGN